MARKDSEKPEPRQEARPEGRPESPPEALYSLRALARRFRRNRRTITLIVERLGLVTIEAGNARLIRHRDLSAIRAEVAKCKPAEWGGVGVKKKPKAPEGDSAAPRSSPGDPLARSA